MNVIRKKNVRWNYIGINSRQCNYLNHNEINELIRNVIYREINQARCKKKCITLEILNSTNGNSFLRPSLYKQCYYPAFYDNKIQI